jgi:hypothetical protein
MCADWISVETPPVLIMDFRGFAEFHKVDEGRVTLLGHTLSIRYNLFVSK